VVRTLRPDARPYGEHALSAAPGRRAK
jgi:hypothetical protein